MKIPLQLCAGSAAKHSINDRFAKLMRYVPSWNAYLAYSIVSAGAVVQNRHQGAQRPPRRKLFAEFVS